MVPVFPESAPFTPAQRAWLNGFFAGYLGLSAGNGEGPAASEGAEAPAAPAAEEEDHAWHDPALSLSERMELAEGKPHEHQLMAAMAQLDCGTCGYVCKTYSEAIARGEEKDLNRCTPGGQETSRKLKELVKARGAASSNGAATTIVGVLAGNGAATHPAAVVEPTFHRSNPFPARLIECRPLNREGSRKNTRHIAIDLSGSDLTYKPGDALGVYPENCPELVEEILDALGVAGDRPDLRASLLREYCLGRPGDELIGRLFEGARDPEEAHRLSQVLDGKQGWIETADLLEVLRRHPAAAGLLEAEALVGLLAPLQPRLYSISSSPRAHPGEVHLTVGVVRYVADEDRQRKGVASTFLAERVAAGGEVRVFVHPSHRFQLPQSGDTPMIMVGPGTGIAPFRAFLEERQAAGATGKNWLFFGDQYRATDFLYQEELHEFQAGGVLTRLDLAFSRDQAEKVYVQDKMLERGRVLWDWLEEGAHFYVCGDAKRMANDVDKALRQVAATHGGLSDEDARAYVTRMTKAGRYQRDVY